MSDPSQVLLQASQSLQKLASALSQSGSAAQGLAKKVLAVHARSLHGQAKKMAQNARVLAQKGGGATSGGAAASGAAAPTPEGGGGLQVQWGQARTHSGFPPEARRWRKGEKGKWIYAAASSINKNWQNNRVIPFTYNGKPFVARQTWHSHQAATGRTGRFKATEIYPRK